MLDAIVPFLKELVLIPLTQLPIINPFSSAPVLIANAGRDKLLVRHLARQVSLNSFYVIIASMLVGTNVLAAVVAVAGVAVTAFVLYVFFSNAGVVLTWLGEMGALVMMRLIAFILLCVGLQIMWTGWAELNMILPE